MSTHSQFGSHRVVGADAYYASHGFLEVPSLVQWMATLCCRLSCEHCLAVSEESGFADMPLDRVKGLIDEITRMGVREFLISGGEPLVREDLGEVIVYFGHHGINWTLNTAAFPNAEQRAVLSKFPPGFVAVSLDGPKAVHDGFRGKVGAYEEALESIRFFKSLKGVCVCAGTTVTSRNYNTLDETFHLAVGSGADQWGIHLLVPEGRAAERKDLFLSRAQLKRLIKFVARRRQYFNVQMADEIGYLGFQEPLVRDVPLQCGAGRSQCVVLPDGSVVPCTTLDRSYSAGNVHEQSLRDIWTTGFTDLRQWQPKGRCGRCDYSIACKGGCWLQRKAGTACFKDVWYSPDVLKTAAGVAICLGGVGAFQSPTTASADAITPTEGATRYAEAAEVDLLALDEVIAQAYTQHSYGPSFGALPRAHPSIAAEDPAWVLFQDFFMNRLSSDVQERCVRLSRAMDTPQRSLSVLALAWRVIQEPHLDGDSLAHYSFKERSLIRETLAALEKKAHAWRQEIFRHSLDPYLNNGRQMLSGFYRGKAGGYSHQHLVSRDVKQERWGIGHTPDTRDAAEAYMRRHPLGEHMALRGMFHTSGSYIHFRGGREEVKSINEISTGTRVHQLGIFDVIEVLDDLSLSFEILGNGLDRELSRGRIEEIVLEDQSWIQTLDTITVELYAGQTYTYGEMLAEAYRQHRDRLLQLAAKWLSEQVTSLDNPKVVTVSVTQNGPLLWPALREIRKDPTLLPSINNDNAALNIGQCQRLAMVKDVDFWMF